MAMIVHPHSHVNCKKPGRILGYILHWSGLLAQLLVTLSSTNMKVRCTTAAETLLAVLISLGLTAGIGSIAGI